MKMRSEKTIENDVKRYIENQGGWWIKIQGGSNNPSVGVPDLLACINGRFVAIELKRSSGGVVSEIQKEQIRRIKNSGGVAFVASDVGTVRMELERAKII